MIREFLKSLEPEGRGREQQLGAASLDRGRCTEQTTVVATASAATPRAIRDMSDPHLRSAGILAAELLPTGARLDAPDGNRVAYGGACGSPAKKVVASNALPTLVTLCQECDLRALCGAEGVIGSLEVLAA